MGKQHPYEVIFMAKKSEIPTSTSPSEDGIHHYGMILGGIVAIVAVVSVVLLISGEVTGVVIGMYNIPENACTYQCGPGMVGRPMGHEGMNGIVYCLCKKV